MKDRFFCASFSDAPGFPGCCPMCHDDHDEDYAEMVEYEIDDRAGLVCCDVMNWLDTEPGKAAFATWLTKTEEEERDMKMIATQGYPRSGKSTWAREQGAPIVCPDSIRLALHGQRYAVEAEPIVWAIARTMVKSLLLSGHDVVIFDSCAHTVRRRDDLRVWGRDDGYDVEFHHVDTSWQECAQRAKEEGDKDIIPIIARMVADVQVDEEHMT